MSLLPLTPGMYRDTSTVTYADADARGRLRISALLNYMQVTAGNHSEAAGFDYLENRNHDRYWVLSRLTLQLDKLPRWKDKIYVDTWGRDTKAVLALRDYRFGSENLGLCGRASSAWVLVQNRKPLRPESHVTNFKAENPPPPLCVMPEVLPELSRSDDLDEKAAPLFKRSATVTADWESIDMNGHVNNVNAVQWCLGVHDIEFHKQWVLSKLEVNFLSEMLPGEEFTISWEEGETAEGNPQFLYRLTRNKDDHQVCLRMRTVFTAE